MEHHSAVHLCKFVDFFSESGTQHVLLQLGFLDVNENYS